MTVRFIKATEISIPIFVTITSRRQSLSGLSLCAFSIVIVRLLNLIWLTKKVGGL